MQKQISAFALLVIALFMFVACDDEPVTEPAPAAPLSDLEWTQTWYDVEPVGSPIFDRVYGHILVPVRGVFDLVKVSREGEELWRRADNHHFACAGSNYIPGFYVVSHADESEFTLLFSCSSTGELGDFVSFDSISASAVVRQSEASPVLVIGERQNANSKRRVAAVAVSSAMEIVNEGSMTTQETTNT